ncbi:MAG: PD-(D/E)XK nuclease domain-containing protein, partial [Candidatus Sericytochromatia bacterium]
IKIIKEYDIDIKKLENIVLSKEDFSSYDIDEINVYAILFQTGYLTIKEIIYDEYEKDYVLSYPNKEVKDSLLKYILNDYIGKILTSEISIKALLKALQRKNIDDFINILKSIFASIPNQIHPEKNNTVSNKEYYYHTIFHLIFTLIGVKISSEVSVSKGFIDSVVETNDTVYIFEFKLEKSPKIALDQIENRTYYEKYLSSNKEIILVGVSFDMEERSIKDYLIRKLA